MKLFCATRARTACLQCLVLILSGERPVRALAIDVLSTVRIEEDWELVVSTPETNSNSPQVTCAMSPVGSDESAYMSFEINHQSQPDYAIGGLHLHAWNGEYLQGSVHARAAVPFQTANELISWTQSMTLSSGTLTYEITNGSSTTWGAFGAGELRLIVSTQLTNLVAYRTQDSLDSSGVGFGANRVSSLVLKRVRYITDVGQTYEVIVDHNVLQ